MEIFSFFGESIQQEMNHVKSILFERVHSNAMIVSHKLNDVFLD